MRTKTLLLSAAALLAAGFVSTQAQPVYSQNIVGYANVATPGDGTKNYLITVPFAIGQSNGANEIWPGTTLPDGSQILIWDPISASYTIYNSFSGYSTGWADANFGQVPAPELPVGQGFFLNPFSPVTNTFAGTIVVNVGTTNGMPFPSADGTKNYLVGCVVPYAGAVTNGHNGSPDFAGGPNLTLAGGLPDGSQILIWDPIAANYTIYNSFSGYTSGWADANFGEVPPPQISVGQGFFLNPFSPFTWQVGL